MVVLSYGLWQRRFGGNPNVIGSALSLGNEPYTIIGVLGRDFLSDPEADIWVPFQFEPNSTNQGHFFQVAAMLRPGITLAQANAQMKLASQQYLRALSASQPARADSPWSRCAIQSSATRANRCWCCWARWDWCC